MSDILKECLSGTISLLFLVIQFLILYFIKKQKIYAAINEIFGLLPELVNSAEVYGFVDGKSKKNHVMNIAMAKLSTRLGIKVEDAFKRYGDLISVKIEEILSTPHKKEVAHEA